MPTGSMHRVLIVLLLLSCANSSLAQTKDTLRAVRALRLHPLIRLPASLKNTVEMDSAQLASYNNETLASLLAQQSYSFVRQYGTNGPSTLLLRGASAAQTAVRWNGVPIQNGATGIVDLSLIPVAALNKVSVEMGSAGSYEGSGAIGGVLYLSTPQPKFDGVKTIAATLAGGSFGNVTASGRAVLSSAKWSGFAGVQYQHAGNDFTYTDLQGRKVRLENARIDGANIEAGIARKISGKDVLSLSLWANRYDREIPPALFESYSVKDLKDAGIRSLLTWQHINVRSAYGANASVINDWFEYHDSAASVNSKYQTRQLFGNLWAKKYLPHHILLDVQLPLQYNYFVGQDMQNISRAALVAAVRKYFFHGLHEVTSDGTPRQISRAEVLLTGRAEAIQNKEILLGDLSATYSIIRSFRVRASLGNTYRYPTLNELYYFPGGNRNLRPERGWSTEAGYDWAPLFSNTAVTFTHKGTAYYRDIHDWIIWFGGAIWTPHNIAEVVSKGFETDNRITYRRPKISYHISAGASAVSSTTIKSELPGDGSIGHQIPYAPRFVSQGNVGFNTAQWRFNYNHTYTADRYYNSDETGLLQSFATGNIQAGWLYRNKSWSADLAVTLQNIWDARYAEVSGRPAMGRNFLLSCTVSNL